MVEAFDALLRGHSIMTRYDFIVIGSGPAGRRAAIQAANWGMLSW